MYVLILITLISGAPYLTVTNVASFKSRESCEFAMEDLGRTIYKLPKFTPGSGLINDQILCEAQ